MGSEYVIGYIVGAVIWGIIWGVVAKAVVTNKGYADKGTEYFWLGFFFSFIPVIVAATKPVYQSQDNQWRSTPLSKTEIERQRQQEIIDNGGWKCVCGRVNYYYSSRCYCGKSRSEGDVKKHITKESENVEAKSDASNIIEYSETERIKLIKDYKELLDAELITQEEFEKKKEQLLWKKTISSDNRTGISESGKSDKDEKEIVIPEGSVIPLPGEKEDTEVCPLCGDVQRGGRTKCWKCGVQFARVEE